MEVLDLSIENHQQNIKNDKRYLKNLVALFLLNIFLVFIQCYLLTKVYNIYVSFVTGAMLANVGWIALQIFITAHDLKDDIQSLSNTSYMREQRNQEIRYREYEQARIEAEKSKAFYEESYSNMLQEYLKRNPDPVKY